jgi:predicted CoA-binding protein
MTKEGRGGFMSDACEMPLANATSEEVKTLLRGVRTIAVVGLSNKPERDSYRVAAYLQRAGYRVIPVNPRVAEVLGEKAYARLQDVPEKIDLVDVFRRPEAVPEIVDGAIAVGARGVWMQEGIVHNAAAQKARAAGLQVVMNKCILKEHRRLGG